MSHNTYIIFAMFAAQYFVLLYRVLYFNGSRVFLTENENFIDTFYVTGTWECFLIEYCSSLRKNSVLGRKIIYGDSNGTAVFTLTPSARLHWVLHQDAPSDQIIFTLLDAWDQDGDTLYVRLYHRNKPLL